MGAARSDAVAYPVHLERRGPQLLPQLVLGRLVDRAHHPVAVPLRGLAGRMVQQRQLHPAGAVGVRVIAARADHHQVRGLADALGMRAHIEGLHVQGDAQVLSHDHASVMISTAQPRSASSSATLVAWWKPRSSTTTTSPAGSARPSSTSRTSTTRGWSPAQYGGCGRAPVASTTASGVWPRSDSAVAATPVLTSTPWRWHSAAR